MSADIFDKGLDESGSVFDMSIATLIRMNTELIKANIFSGMETSEGLKGWFQSLLTLDREVSPFLLDKEEVELAKLRNRAGSIPRLTSNRSLGYDYHILAKILDTYERFLRKFMAKKDLYMRKREDVGTSILR